MDSKGRILLVDDEEFVIESLQPQLQERSYTVLAATSGEQALVIMDNNEIDILLTDIRMPAMDGVELIRQTKEKYPEIKSIIITGHADLDSAAEAMRLGAINYLRKPKDMKIDIVDSALEKAMEEKKNKENNIEKEIVRRRKAEPKLKRRKACVALMRVCMRYWENVILEDKWKLAEKCISGGKVIWKLYIDENGSRPRRLVKYCDINTIPENPKINDVIETAYFILSYKPVKPDNEMKNEIKQRLKELETLMETFGPI